MEQLRTSSYVISVKLEEEQDKYMLVHGYTGAIDIVNGKTAHYLETQQTVLEQAIPFSSKTLDALTTRGYLTTKNAQEEVEHVKKIAGLLHRRNKIFMKNFMFLVAYDCNFRCPYCYENDVSINGRQWSGKVFTKEMVDKAYDAMLKIEKERRLHKNHILLYGGEPLLSKNKEVVQYIVDKGKALGYRFGAITNGYDLADFKELLSPDQISFLQITVDGNREQHDKRRIHYATKKSFDQIVENIGLALQQGVTVKVRINTDANNVKSLNELNELFTDLGYLKHKTFSFYSALLVDYQTKDKSAVASVQANNPSDDKKSLNYMSRDEFNLHNKNGNNKYNCQDYGICSKLYSSMTENRHLNFDSIFCKAQSSEYIFDPFGEIYGCWNTIGNKEYIIGNFDCNTIQWTNVLERWHNKHTGISSCCTCKYALLCGGGCLFHAILKNGEIDIPYCNDYSDTFKHSANLSYKKYISEKIDIIHV